MSSFFEGVKRGVKAVTGSHGPSSYRAGGIKVICTHCKNDVFQQGEAQLNTATASLFNLDWLNKSAKILICTQCGLIQWFGNEPQKMEQKYEMKPGDRWTIQGDVVSLFANQLEFYYQHLRNYWPWKMACCQRILCWLTRDWDVLIQQSNALDW